MHTLEDLIKHGYQPAQDEICRQTDERHWKEGRQGFLDRADNPYPNNCRSHYAWLLGYCWQRKELRDFREREALEIEAKAKYEAEARERRKAKQARNKINRAARGQQQAQKARK